MNIKQPKGGSLGQNTIMEAKYKKRTFNVKFKAINVSSRNSMKNGMKLGASRLSTEKNTDSGEEMKEL